MQKTFTRKSSIVNSLQNELPSVELNHFKIQPFQHSSANKKVENYAQPKYTLQAPLHFSL